MTQIERLLEATMITMGEGFCKAAHFGQKRKFTGENYAAHPVRVANILNDHGYKDANTQIAALLHDVVEDTPITNEYIEQYFGKDVADMVEWLTKRDWKRADGKPMKRWERKELEADRLKNAPVLVKTIKLADRLDNMTMLTEETPAIAKIFAAETRHLLDYALRDGDPVLWHKVSCIVYKFQKEHSLLDNT